MFLGITFVKLGTMTVGNKEYCYYNSTLSSKIQPNINTKTYYEHIFITLPV